jgi:hypothetical protein
VNKKVEMSVSEKSGLENKPVNVLALFSEIVIPETTGSNITEEEDAEFLMQEEVIVAKPRRLVSENQFPDQSLFILDAQLSGLKESLSRIKFYLGDVDDLMPR